MDATVIEEISDQLGMAADQAGQFITEHLPDFAALKAMQATAPLVIVWSLVALCFAVAAVSILLAAHERRKCMDDDDQPRWHSTHDWENYHGTWVALVAAIAGASALFAAVFLTGFRVPELIGWQQYPEAMLIDMALKAVG